MSEMVRPPLRQVRSRIFDSARWAGYRARPDDIIIATYPKCGTTWTQRIVSMLLAGSAAPAPVGGPWFDFRLRGPVEPVLAGAEATPGRRHLKSHLPYDALPVWEGVKFIHVARDGRDSALSMHNHLRGFTPQTNAIMDQVSLNDPKFGDAAPPTPEDPAESFREWLIDGGARGDPGASFWEVERSYWAARRDPNMLLVHFNDLKADLAGEIVRIARYLEIELAGAVMGEIVAAANFDAMREQGEALMPGAENAWVNGAKTFLNKGVNGRWQGLYAAADLAAYQAGVAAEFTPALAAWLEGGRLAAGDPALSAD
ncbi:MAG TPA: sulfotransferase domain-containing protein [Caulobacteraceae bacterium]|nr:sulfotransferase domain-containing protein [Caulobacteraceae bacterium]